MFDALAASGKKALIPYVTAGDPHADTTPAVMHALVEGGADVIELGVPFSDPMADGPVIQKASERALARGIGLAQVLAMVREFRGARPRDAGRADGLRESDRALWRPPRFVARRARAGVDGVLVVDYPPEECVEFAQLLRDAGIDPIFLLAPTSTDERIAAVAKVGAATSTTCR